MIPFEPGRKWRALFPPSSLTLFFLCSFAVFPGKAGMKKLWNAFSGTGSCAWKSCSPSVSFVWKAVFCAGRHCWTASSAWNWKYTRTVLFMQRCMMRTGRISGMLTRERKTGCGQECSAGNMRKNCGMWRNAALNLIFSRRLPPGASSRTSVKLTGRNWNSCGGSFRGTQWCGGRIRKNGTPLFWLCRA